MIEKIRITRTHGGSNDIELADKINEMVDVINSLVKHHTPAKVKGVDIDVDDRAERWEKEDRYR
jgi:hypothetical protein